MKYHQPNPKPMRSRYAGTITRTMHPNGVMHDFYGTFYQMRPDGSIKRMHQKQPKRNML